MPDKKITQQTEHITAVLGVDLLPMVANVATTPTNYKVQIKNFLSQLQIDLPLTSFSALKLSAFMTANATTATMVAAELGVFANSSIFPVVNNQYGLVVNNKIQNGNSNVTGQLAAALFTLDPGNSNFAIANTYGVMISHALDANVAAARWKQPRAYVAILEDAGSNTAAKTAYLLDVGAQSKTISSDTANANTSVVHSKTADKTVTHTLKISVNGTDYWMLLSNTAPA